MNSRLSIDILINKFNIMVSLSVSPWISPWEVFSADSTVIGFTVVKLPRSILRDMSCLRHIFSSDQLAVESAGLSKTGSKPGEPKCEEYCIWTDSNSRTQRAFESCF